MKLRKNSNTNTSTNTSSNSDVDWQGFNEHVLDVLGKPQPQIGIIAAIIDLGDQPQTGNTFDYNPEDARHDKWINDGWATAGVDEETGKDTITLPPREPFQQEVAIYVDFPDLQVDYGHFFNDGESEYRPYRQLMNGEFRGIMEYGYGVEVGDGGLHPKSSLAKIAVDAQAEDVIKSCDTADLLGRHLQFSLGCKKDGEKIFVNMKARTQPHSAIPVPEYELEPFEIEFDEEYDEDTLKQIRFSVRKYMEKANNFEGSALQRQLNELYNNAPAPVEEPEEEEEEEQAPPAKKVAKKVVKKKVVKAPPQEEEEEPEEEEEEQAPPPKKKVVKKKVGKKPAKDPVEEEPEEEEEEEQAPPPKKKVPAKKVPPKKVVVKKKPAKVDPAPEPLEEEEDGEFDDDIPF